MPAHLRRHKKALALLLLTWGSYFIFLFSRMISLRPNGLVFGNENVWSDWPLHIAIAQTIAFKSPHLWFAYHPLYAGGKLTYPFLANLISGLLMRLGWSLPLAFIVPSIITAVALLVGMYGLWYVIFRSSKQAVVAISLFLLSSGWGFVHFLKDIATNHSWLSLITAPPVYSRLEQYQWYTGNVINGMLLPQRAFLLGMTIAVWALLVLLVCLQRPVLAKKYKWFLFAAGLGVGLLPIAHMHSFMAVAVISACLFATTWRRWPIWLLYGLPAAGLSLLTYSIFIRGGIENPHFMRLALGWTAHGVLDWLHQWWWQWGLAPFVALLGYLSFRPQAKNYHKAFFASFIILFVMANIILFQPTQWDNSKIFLWVYFGLSGLMAHGLAWLWRRPSVWWQSVAMIIAICLIFSGVLEAWRLQAMAASPFLASSNEEIDLGRQIRQQTDPQAIFLTAPLHNSLISMWAVRPILIGYIGWVSNYGFLYREREKDMMTMYRGEASTPDLLHRYGISYVVIGPSEKRLTAVNPAYFADHYPVAFISQHYVIYDVRHK